MTNKKVKELEDLKYYESLSEQGKLEYLDFIRSLHGGSRESFDKTKSHKNNYAKESK